MGFVFSGSKYNIVKRDPLMAISEDTGAEIPLTSLASMNMWGVTPEYLDELEVGFKKFLKEVPKDDIKAEYLLPTIMGGLIEEKRAQITVLPTRDKWFGITYAADKAKVIDEFASLVKKGVYKSPLND